MRTGPRPARMVYFSGGNAPLRVGLTGLPGRPQCPASRLIAEIGNAEISLLACSP